MPDMLGGLQTQVHFLPFSLFKIFNEHIGCEDLNECCFGTNPQCNHNCEINLCTNTIGSFTCDYCPWEAGNFEKVHLGTHPGIYIGDRK